jgi:short-subunit dehydrogenase
MDRVVILGASRGLGAELARVAAQSGVSVMGFSRKASTLQALAKELENFNFQAADFSKPESQTTVLDYLTSQPIARVFYVAGGGPFGPFHKREWKDHQWAWDVSFLFAARVAHALRQARLNAQLILVGSAVAEAAVDPGAASYSAAKHALKGLFLALRAENPEWDVRLFSPGYLDTEMLPANAAVRQKGVYEARVIAQELWDWSTQPQSPDDSGHKLYPVHPA